MAPTMVPQMPNMAKKESKLNNHVVPWAFVLSLNRKQKGQLFCSYFTLMYCSVPCVLCTVYPVCCVQYTLFVVYSVPCVLYPVCCVQCTLCVVYSVPCVLCTVYPVCCVHCVLYLVCCVQCLIQLDYYFMI